MRSGGVLVDAEIESCIRDQYARLVGIVSVTTGSTALAEDAVQEAFARAWERSQRGQDIEHLAAWVVTVALNQARSGHRRRQAEQRALARIPVATAAREGDGTNAIDVRMVVRAAIEGLSRRQRDAVVLYYLLDVDVATVARLLAVSEGTVKSALSRARTHLAAALGHRELET